MPSPRIVYMDNHATTRVDPRVVETMLPYFTEEFGNAGSVGHAFGEGARTAVEGARQTIAAAINSQPAEIVFTSGATESSNLAIRGVAERTRRRGDHLISVRTEHAAVLGPLQRLERKGYRVTLLEVEPHRRRRAGWLDPQRVADAIDDDTALASVMLANNEIGVIQPLAEIAAICRERDVPLHCDATQAVGKIPVAVDELGVDLMSFSAHKIYGPKGVGALYVRRRRPALRLDPLLVGGGQEGGLRSGTLNVAGIVGFAAAVAISQEELRDEMPRLKQLRDRLWGLLSRQLDPVELAGPDLNASDDDGGPLRLPGNLNIVLGDVDGEAVQLKSVGLAISSGAACSSSDPRPSHVLSALGLDDDQARSSLRFGLGRFNEAGDIDFAARSVASAVRELRQFSGK